MGIVDLKLPPGFRFHPTDEELVKHYLCARCTGKPISVPVVTDIDLYKYNPWDLPGMALYGEKEWYFFTPRDRKYPNGSRPNRAAGVGYWKATGVDKVIGIPKSVGIKKALVFYAGKAPKGEKTNWIMHEYRLADVNRLARKGNINSLRLDDWVLCRIYNKKGGLEKHGSANPNPQRAGSVTIKQDPTTPEHLPHVYIDTSDSSPGFTRTPAAPSTCYRRTSLAGGRLRARRSGTSGRKRLTFRLIITGMQLGFSQILGRVRSTQFKIFWCICRSLFNKAIHAN